MREITMSKDALHERVQKNRDGHREIYEKAMEGYTEAATRFFTEQLARAKDGKPFMSYFSEPMPEDHTADYDVVLDMIDSAVEDEFKLSASEFRQYVRDEWGWKEKFSATASNYGVAA